MAILTSTGRVLLGHWPAMLAWFLGGILVHYLFVQIAGFVGAYSATLGFLVLPLAILARLISLVAMFLVLRDGLRNLQEIAPVPEAPAERRKTFLAALLAGILPFFAVYWAQGLLSDDVVAYSGRALEVRTDVIFTSDSPVSSTDTVLNLPMNVWTVSIIVIAFAGRWAWSKWSAKLWKTLAPVAVYFEVVWVFFSVMLLSDVTDTVKAWVDSRAAMAFVERVREQILDAAPPLRWLVDGIGVLLAEAGPVMLSPLAWLTIGGVIYGQAIVAEKLRVENRLLARLKERAGVVPSPVMRRLKELGSELGARFLPIWRAAVLMWRAGPVLVASYALLYVAVKTLESYVDLAVTRVIGPLDLVAWSVIFPLVMLIPQLLVEPLRISVIAGAYDTTLGRMRVKQQTIADAAHLTPGEADERAVAAAAGLPAPMARTASNGPSGQGSTENLTNRPSAP